MRKQSDFRFCSWQPARNCGLHSLIHTYEKAVVKLESSVNCSSGTTILGSSPNTYPWSLKGVTLSCIW